MMAFDLATARPVEPQEPADGPIDGQALAALLLALDRPVLQPLAEPVDLGPVQATPTHWEVPRGSRWRCHCTACGSAAAAGRRAFRWGGL